MTTLQDIRSRKDIEVLIDLFYKRILIDDVIGHFFTEVVPLHWEKHIPIMYDFWESILFGKAVYKGNPMIKHIVMNQKEPLTPIHFKRWLRLWEETINSNFKGSKAEEAIQKANQIGGLMQFKIAQQSKQKK